MKTTKIEVSEYEQQALDFLKATHTTFSSEFKEFNSMPWDEKGEKRNIFTIKLSNSRNRYSFDFGSSIQDSCKPYPLIYSKENTQIYYGFSFPGHGRTTSSIVFTFQILTNYQTLLKIKDTKDYDSIIDYRELQSRFDDLEKQITEDNKKRKPFQGHIKNRDINEIIISIKQAIAKKIKQAEEDTFLGQQADEIKHPTAYDVLTCLTKYDPGTFENFCSDFGYDTDSRKAERTYKACRKEWQQVAKLFTADQLELLQEIQ